MQTFYHPQTLITWDVRAPLCMALQSIITAFLICLTPKKSLLRLGVLPILLYLSVISVRTASAFSLQLMLYLGFAVNSYVNVFHCFNFLWFHPFDDADIQLEMALWKKYPANPGLLQRVYFTTATLWSFRGVGTTYEIKSMPKFRGGVVPSKPLFLLEQVGMIVFQYLFMDLITSQPQAPEMADTWAVGKEWLWLPQNPYPVTTEDLVSRFMGTLMSWYLIGKMMLDTWYRFFALIFVGLGITEVKQWPPMYGDYSQCYTLRRYFNNFWHQCLRLPLQGVSRYITHDLLRLRPSLFESYLTMFFVFAISGHFHILLDYCLGMTSWRLSGGVQCFTLIVPGIMFEDFVQWGWRKYTGKSRKGGPGIVGRVVGYVWVFFYLGLVTPVFNFPLQRIENNPTYLVPWSVVNHFK